MYFMQFYSVKRKHLISNETIESSRCVWRKTSVKHLFSHQVHVFKWVLSIM